MNLRREFYNNILISGGTSMLPGFPTRLLKEVGGRFREKILKGASVSSSIKIRVIDPPTRKYNVFIGASIMASQTDKYAEIWKSKQEY